LGSPPTPAVDIPQRCTMSGGSDHVLACDLGPISAGDKIVFGGIQRGPTLITTLAPGATETPTCPAGTFLVHNYSAQDYDTLICYVDVASSHSVFTASISYSGCPGCRGEEFYAMRVTGASSGSDTAGAAACAATSCAFTTLASGEFAVGISADIRGGNPPIPGNSFNQSGYSISTLDAPQAQGLWMSKIVTGTSDTISFSQSDTTSPMTAVLPFGVPAAAKVKHVSSIL